MDGLSAWHEYHASMWSLGNKTGILGTGPALAPYTSLRRYIFCEFADVSCLSQLAFVQGPSDRDLRGFESIDFNEQHLVGACWCIQ